MRRRWFWMPATAAVLALAMACTPEADEPLAGATSGPPAASSTPPTSPAPSPSAAASPSEVLEARYYTDSDGNVIPDFLELEMGLDPEVDDCLQEPCPDADEELLTPDADALEHNLLLILDASGSMAGPDGTGSIKIDAAREALERYVVGTPDTTNLGLMVYGHRGDNTEAGKATSCKGIELLAPLGELDPDNAGKVLGRFSPTGWTPIADSLRQAADAFAGHEGQDNRVVLVTDGIETCDGDPVEAATALSESDIAVTVDVVGFDVASSDEQAALRAIAEATDGTYATARNADELHDYIDNLQQQQRALFQAYTCLQEAWLRSAACTAQASAEAAQRLAAERAGTAVGSARYEAINELIAGIAQWSIANRKQANEVMVPRLEELRTAYIRAHRRYEQRYRRSLSMSVPADFRLRRAENRARTKRTLSLDCALALSHPPRRAVGRR